MFLDLTLAGIFQGYYWASLQPWEASVDGSQPFWHVRAVAGLAMFAGLLCFLVNLS
jgi:cytochrome c oxidase cbb3-type subunit 1